MKASALVALLCVILLSACGGGSKELSASDYRAKLATLGKEVTTAQAGIQQALKAKTVADLSARLKAFADAESRIGTEVGKLNPPKDAKTANEELAKGQRDIATAIRNLATQVGKAASVQAGLKLLEQDQAAGSAGQAVDHAIAALKKLGYSEGS